MFSEEELCLSEINVPLHTVIHPQVGGYAVSVSVFNSDLLIKVGKMEYAL